MSSFYKAIPDKRKKIIYIIILFIFSTSVNQYYGYQGIQPIDSFFSFNSGYDVLNGYFPFKDYWTITGPFIDFTVAIFFKLFGVSWFSYILYASIFNFIISFATFYTLEKFKLNINYCFFYSILVAILAYPSAGTPYVDHQSAFLSVIAIYFFVLALKTDFKIYWLLIPIILGISFLTKQAPTGHFILIISILSLIYFTFNFDLKKIIFAIIGFFLFLFSFCVLLFITKIQLGSFLEQYILFPLSLGESRLEFLFPLEFKRVILRYKLIHLSLLVLMIISIKKIIQDYKYLKHNDFLIVLALLSSAFALIAHQLMTINGMFIFFLIPILTGFSHIYFLKYFKHKKYILYFLIFLSIGSTIHYGNKYINKRNFMHLNKVNMNNAIDAKIFGEEMSGLKWITPFQNPKKEISNLLEAIDIIKKDSRNKMLVTDYQFISVVMSTYDNSLNKYWFRHHAYPSKKHKYFEIYKKFFIKKLKEGEIEIVYEIKPLWGETDVLEPILASECITKITLTDILDGYLLQKCEDLRG
jgi:hypothetical protein